MVKKEVTLDIFMRKEELAESAEEKRRVKKPYDLPEKWKWVKLRAIVTAVGGGTPATNNPNYWGGNIPWASPKDLKNFELYDTRDHITEEGLEKSSTKLIPSNSVLVVFRGSLLLKKRKIPVTINRVPVAINQDIKALIPKKDITPEFLAFYLRSIEHEISSNCVKIGATVRSIIPRRFFELKVPLPPLEEQKRIVSRLEQLVSRVEEAKRLRKSAKEETEKIMQAALHKVFSRAEEKRWKWVKLRDVLKEDRQTINPQNYPDREFFLITMDCIESDTGRLLKIVKCYGKEIKSTKYVFNTKHILYGKLRPYLNKVYVPDREGICTTEFIPFVVINALREYVAFYLRKREVVDFAMRHITGTRQPRVIIDELLEYPIPLPPLEEQKNIVASLDKLSKITESLRKLQQSTEEELEQLVPAILDKAFKGRL